MIPRRSVSVDGGYEHRRDREQCVWPRCLGAGPREAECVGECAHTCDSPAAYDLRYHVPRSQVWGGSRGAQSGKVHLHVRAQFDHGRIHRNAGQALCGKRGWYEREPMEGEQMCPRCEEVAVRVAA